MKRGLIAYLVLFALAALIFDLFPGVDLWASSLFYRGGEGFFLRDDRSLRILFQAVFYLTDAITVLLPLIFIVSIWRKRPILGIDHKAAVFLLLSLVIGPGILVNSVLKDNWGRARPVQVLEFAGTQHFTPVLEPTNQCARNCSFPAGHPSIGFFLVSFAFLIPSVRKRRIAIGGALAFGGLVGLARIMQGGHFLSDVVFSGLLIFATSWLLYQAVLRELWLALPTRMRGIAVLTVGCALAAAISFAFYDRPIAIYFHGIDSRTHGIFVFITQFGLGKGYLIISGLAFIGCGIASLRIRDSRIASICRLYARRAAFLFLAVMISGIVVDLLKVIFGRARPKLLFRDNLYGFTWWGSGADLWSFPSGHSATVIGLAVALTLIWRRAWPLYWALALLICASRLIIDAHYLSDVIVGGCIGVVTVWLIQAAYERFGFRLSDTP